MARTLLAIVISALLFQIQPAEAFFGNSECKKAKSTVMKNYVTELRLLTEYHKAFGFSAPEIGLKASAPKSKKIRMMVLKKTADFEYKNFRFVMDNYNCFTESQHKYAIRMFDYWYMIKSYTDLGLNYVRVLERTQRVSTFSVLDY